MTDKEQAQQSADRMRLRTIVTGPDPTAVRADAEWIVATNATECSAAEYEERALRVARAYLAAATPAPANPAACPLCMAQARLVALERERDEARSALAKILGIGIDAGGFPAIYDIARAALAK